MNKDEMIKDLKRDYKLCVTCEMFNGWVDDSGNIHDAGCLEYLNCDCNATNDLANILFNAGYRKIGEDIVIIDREAWENSHKSNARLYKDFQEAKKKTAREIFYKLKETLIINNEENTEWFDYDFTLETINELAKSYGIELED